MPIDVTGSSIRIRQRDPGDFDQKSFRTIDIDKKKGIKAVVGKLKGKDSMTVQTLIFPKDMGKDAAKKWASDNDFKASEEANMQDEKTIQEAVWSTAFVNNLPDSAFLHIKDGGEKDSDGKTKPRSLRMFPYKDNSGKVDLAHLRNALARIPQSSLDDATKKRVIAKARRIAKDAGVDVSESFLDDYELVGPLFHPYLETTLHEFNEGTLFNGEYESEDYDMFGRKLARAMNSWNSTGSSTSTYDENGNQTSYTSSNEDEGEREWEYHDGLVVRTKTSGDSSYTSTSEYSQARIGEDSDGEMIAVISEANDKGSAVKAMRMKKKMSRDQMSTKMDMSAARLKEIEEGDDISDDEMNQIAKGLGMSPQKMKRIMDTMMGDGESTNSNGLVRIVDRKIRIISPPFTVEKFETFKAEFYPTVPKYVYAECGYDRCHELVGTFIQESIQEEKDGSLRFSVPLFKENELTYNNNRYTTECSENMLKHLAKLNKRNSTLETSFLDALKGSVEESSNAAYVIESMKQQPLLMLASHDARQGKGNFLKDVAGRVLGGRREKIEGSMCFVLEGKTIKCPTGDQISGLMREGVMRGVSLFSYPFKFEENKEGAHDVSNMLLVGTDFTNEGGNLRHFKDKSLAAPATN